VLIEFVLVSGAFKYPMICRKISAEKASNQNKDEVYSNKQSQIIWNAQWKWKIFTEVE
jgi:hypothetical protein